MDEIEYRPRNVRETLVELKNTSELAVDLAYAAALYGHESLADAVYELEARAESLQYPAKISLLLAAKRADDAERLVGIVQIVDAAVEITNAAANVAAIVRNDIGLPDEVRAALPEADEVVMRATVADDSELVDRSLGELALETETGIDMTAIRRNEDWLLAPTADVVVRAGDVVVGSGPQEGASEVYERATGERWERGAASEAGVEELDRAAETVIDLKNIAELAIGLSYGAVLYDDTELATEVRELEAQSDALQADIETWVIEAGEHVRNPAQLRGLLHLAAASETICDAALDIADIVLRDGEVHPVFGQAISESEELVTTVTIESGSELTAQRLDDRAVEERTGVTVMAIRRRDEWLFAPSGDTVFQTEDVLVVRGPEEGIDQLRAWAQQ